MDLRMVMLPKRLKITGLSLTVVLFMGGIVLAAPAVDNGTCLSCHADPASGKAVDAARFQTSVHGKLDCAGCHQDITEVPHQEKPAPVRCASCHASETAALQQSRHGEAFQVKGSEAAACASCHGPAHQINPSSTALSKVFWENIPATCGECHGDISAVFSRSIHGKAVAAGKREAPVCSDCHGGHAIKGVKDKASQVSTAHIPETCAQCHSAERVAGKFSMPSNVVGTYMDSYHGLSVTRGSLTAANCASCHNTHDILPAADPASSINPANLVKTCGKCHAGMGEQVVKGKIHAAMPSAAGIVPADLARNFYLVLILLVIGFMLVHNIMDLVRKMQAHYRRLAALNKPLRLGAGERVQHIILVVTFLALAYTGFALKFPHAWWTAPFLGQADVRGAAHRLAAVLFMMLGVYHGWFMIFTARGRWHLVQMRPRLIDGVQLGQTLAYYFGRRHEKPAPAFYGYIEKMEYWALVWGSMIMVVTGAILLKKEWFLKYCSKDILDAVATVHYYEAVLACLAIIIWHWYFVMFDPDVYPMKWTWLDGKSTPADDERKIT